MIRERYTFRISVPEAAEQIPEIYSRYVTDIAVTFEYDVSADRLKNIK